MRSYAGPDCFVCVCMLSHAGPVCCFLSTATKLRSCCLQTRVEERGEVIKKKMATPDYAGKTPVRIKEQVSLCASQPLQRVITAMQLLMPRPATPTYTRWPALSTVLTLRPPANKAANTTSAQWQSSKCCLDFARCSSVQPASAHADVMHLLHANAGHGGAGQSAKGAARSAAADIRHAATTEILTACSTGVVMITQF